MSFARKLLTEVKPGLRLMSRPQRCCRALSWLKEKLEARRKDDLTFEEWERLEFRSPKINNNNLRRCPYV